MAFSSSSKQNPKAGGFRQASVVAYWRARLLSADYTQILGYKTDLVSFGKNNLRNILIGGAI